MVAFMTLPLLIHYNKRDFQTVERTLQTTHPGALRLGNVFPSHPGHLLKMLVTNSCRGIAEERGWGLGAGGRVWGTGELVLLGDRVSAGENEAARGGGRCWLHNQVSVLNATNLHP